MNDESKRLNPVWPRIGLAFFFAIFFVAVFLRSKQVNWFGLGYAIDFAWGGLYLEFTYRWRPFQRIVKSRIRERIANALLLIAILYFLEFIQIWIPQRTHDFWDYVVYTAGVTLAFVSDVLLVHLASTTDDLDHS